MQLLYVSFNLQALFSGPHINVMVASCWSRMRQLTAFPAKKNTLIMTEAQEAKSVYKVRSGWIRERSDIRLEDGKLLFISPACYKSVLYLKYSNIFLP